MSLLMVHVWTRQEETIFEQAFPRLGFSAVQCAIKRQSDTVCKWALQALGRGISLTLRWAILNEAERFLIYKPLRSIGFHQRPEKLAGKDWHLTILRGPPQGDQIYRSDLRQIPAPDFSSNLHNTSDSILQYLLLPRLNCILWLQRSL